ncbi:hypothetical protein ANTPLA_LOCUS7579 [Anthophora plagiata]
MPISQTAHDRSCMKNAHHPLRVKICSYNLFRFILYGRNEEISFEIYSFLYLENIRNGVKNIKIVTKPLWEKAIIDLTHYFYGLFPICHHGGKLRRCAVETVLKPCAGCNITPGMTIVTGVKCLAKNW